MYEYGLRTSYPRRGGLKKSEQSKSPYRRAIVTYRTTAPIQGKLAAVQQAIVSCTAEIEALKRSLVEVDMAEETIDLQEENQLTYDVLQFESAAVSRSLHLPEPQPEY